MDRDTTRAALAVLAFGAVLGLTAVGVLGGSLAVDWVVAALGNDYLLVAAVAVVLALAAGSAGGRSGYRVRQASVPDVERPAEAEAPGTTLDAHLDSWRVHVPVLGADRRQAVRDRLRTVAVETVSRVESCSREEATRRIERGSWTDDESAARFLADHDAPAGVPDVPAVGFTAYARRTARVVAALGDAPAGEGADEDVEGSA